jgi:tetraacyldisaccharide 4'-kinase
MAIEPSGIGRVLERIWYSRSAIALILWPVGALTALATVVRRKLYLSGVLESRGIDAYVVVVGNISVGGTGKTPVAIWLAHELRAHGYRVGVICSGYGGEARSWPQLVTGQSDPVAVGDEAVMLAQRAACAVVAGPDRVAAAERLLSEEAVDIILSDDGMQHYRLRRNFELAVVDGTRALGNRMCLPVGPLREPAIRLRSVDAVVVNDGDWGGVDLFRFEMIPLYARSLTSGEQKSLSDFRGQRVHAVAAIGNPDRFFDWLEKQGIVVERHPMRDHAEILTENLAFDDSLPVLLTEKDAVKCRQIANANVWFVVADVRFTAQSGDRLLRLITQSVERQDQK